MPNLITLITPTNLAAEQEKFFGSSTYNPTFHYIWQDEIIEPIFSIPKKYELWEAIKKQDRPAISKIAMDELAAHPTYTGLWPAEQVIKYFNL